MTSVLDSGRFILGPEVRPSSARPPSTSAPPTASASQRHRRPRAGAARARRRARRRGHLPAYTFYATPEAIAAVGATPVFVDIEPGTLPARPRRGRGAIMERTRAVVAVHLFGHPAPMAALRAVCDPAGVPVLEDAAQAIGARLGGGACGSLGAAATFSFFPTKNLGGFGDGGLVTTDDAGVAETRAHPALPRLARQADLRAVGHELAARRAAGGAPARGSCPSSTAGTPRAGRRPSATASWASASTSSCPTRPAARADLPPVRRAHRGARRARGGDARSAASARRSTTAARTTCSPCSRTSATARAACPRPSAPPARPWRCRCSRP